MKKLQTGSKYSLILVILFLCSSNIYAQGKRTEATDSIYNLFKDQMDGLPQVVKDDTLFIGSFNRLDGSFTGIGGEYFYLANGGHGGQIRSYPIVYSKGITTHLRINLSSTDYCSLIIDGIEYNNNGKDYFMIALNTRKKIDFKIIDGAKTFSNKLNLQPYPINAVGAFTLAELPLGIIYVVPGINNDENYAYYSTSESFKTTLSMSSSNSSMNTKSSMDDVSSVIEIGKQIASGIGGMYGTALQIGLTGLSTETITQTEGHINSKGVEIAVENFLSTNFSTKYNRIGIGNSYLYVTNARFIFSIKNSEISISLLDFEEFYRFAVNWLKENDLDRYNRLKLLDPFTTAATPNLESNSRYIENPYGKINLSPSEDFGILEEEISTSSNSRSELNYTTKIIDHQAGWMTSTYGDDESYTKTITLSQSKAIEFTHTEGKMSLAHIVCPLDGAHRYGVYLDNLFKTIIVIDLSVGLASQPTFTGILKDISGKPVANSLVFVMLHGKKITTKTDKTGKYTYHVKELIGFKGTPSVVKPSLTKTKVSNDKFIKSNS